MRTNRQSVAARFDPLSGAARQVLVIAVFAIVASLALGAYVSNRPPGPFELLELGQYGVATPLAKVFTAAGRFPTYFALSIVALAFGIAKRDWLSRSIVSVLLLLVTWQSSDLVKAIFHRARPLHPIVAETSYGYPSGHADQALAFYGFWAFWIWKSDLPRPLRVAVVAALAVWTVAIGWSRLALGAHFPGDVAGGYLFGAGWLGFAIVASSELVRRASDNNRDLNTLGVRISRR